MTTEDMIKTIGKNQKLTQEVVKNVIQEYIELIRSDVIKGEAVRIRGLGTIKTSTVKAHKWFNPQTKEREDVADKKLPRFKFSDSFRDECNCITYCFDGK